MYLIRYNLIYLRFLFKSPSMDLKYHWLYWIIIILSLQSTKTKSTTVVTSLISYSECIRLLLNYYNIGNIWESVLNNLKKKVEMYNYAIMYSMKTAIIIVTLDSYSGLNLSSFVTYLNIKIES